MMATTIIQAAKELMLIGNYSLAQALLLTLETKEEVEELLKTIRNASNSEVKWLEEADQKRLNLEQQQYCKDYRASECKRLLEELRDVWSKKFAIKPSYFYFIENFKNSNNWSYVLKYEEIQVCIEKHLYKAKSNLPVESFRDARRVIDNGEDPILPDGLELIISVSYFNFANGTQKIARGLETSEDVKEFLSACWVEGLFRK
jgi:hypothetical protein